MDWQVDERREDRIEWVRTDRFGRVVLRRTATGEWAVTLDVLEQAPEGPRYDRETFESRAAAEGRAETWRDGHAGDTG
jgi:hypothetical protein